MGSRPWVAGLSRLLHERPGLKKGKLAELSGMRPGNISAILNPPKDKEKKWPNPDMDTLQTLADGLTAWDRRLKGGNPKAPNVQLWEFFVTDEQAGLLRTKAEQHNALTREDEISARVEHRIMSRLAALVREETATEVASVEPKKTKRRA